jgi:hypothetical protein
VVEPVPDGTVQEVLDWVGDDPDRAERALEAERLGDGRSTLISKLEAIASETKEDNMSDATAEEVEEAPGPEQPTEIVIDTGDTAVTFGPVHMRDSDVEVDESQVMRAGEDIEGVQVESLQAAAAINGLALAINGEAFVFSPQMIAVLKQIADQAIASVKL